MNHDNTHTAIYIAATIIILITAYITFQQRIQCIENAPDMARHCHLLFENPELMHAAGN